MLNKFTLNKYIKDSIDQGNMTENLQKSVDKLYKQIEQLRKKIMHFPKRKKSCWKRERIQAFEGTVISRKGGGISETFTVRKLSSGVGVERTFPINSPLIDKITVIRVGKVRRAKLYYLRSRSGKSARIKEVR